MGRIFGCFTKIVEKKSFSTFAQITLLHECLLKLNKLLLSKYKLFTGEFRFLPTRFEWILATTTVLTFPCRVERESVKKSGHARMNKGGVADWPVHAVDLFFDVMTLLGHDDAMPRRATSYAPPTATMHTCFSGQISRW